MVYKRRSYVKRVVKTKRYSKKSSSALTVAKQALQKVNKLTKVTTRPIYYGNDLFGDLSGSAGTLGASFEQIITTPGLGAGSVLFDSTGVTGTEARCDWVKVQYEIHMDNVINNEEETTNFTCSIVSFKKDFDQLQSNASCIFSHNGMVMYNPELIKVHKHRRHTLTMGGTSPGTAGQSVAKGYFFVKINKYIKFINSSNTGTATTSGPSSYQDKMYFLIHTDNLSADGESPRMNGLMTVKWTDTDRA